MKKNAKTAAMAAMFASAAVWLASCTPPWDEGNQGEYGPPPYYPSETTSAAQTTTTTAATSETTTTTEYDSGNMRDGDGYDKTSSEPETTTAKKSKKTKTETTTVKTETKTETSVTTTAAPESTAFQTLPAEVSDDSFEEDDGETFGEEEDIADEDIDNAGTEDAE